MSAKTLEVRAAQYELEIRIDGSRDKVWKALTEETNAWWLPDFHMVGEGSVVHFDARAGGQMIESRADGGSLLWFTVQWCTPGEVLHLSGHVAPDWGGPATSLLKIALEDADGGTLVRFTDAHFGHVSDENLASLEDGWKQLLGSGLKPYVESR